MAWALMSFLLGLLVLGISFHADYKTLSDSIQSRADQVQGRAEDLLGPQQLSDLLDQEFFSRDELFLIQQALLRSVKGDGEPLIQNLPVEAKDFLLRDLDEMVEENPDELSQMRKKMRRRLAEPIKEYLRRQNFSED